MGHNFGAIYVRQKSRLTVKRVRRWIEKFWQEWGVEIDPQGCFDIEPMCLENGGDRLAYAVAPMTDSWIAIADSERYTASEQLAQHLSDKLNAEVLCFQISAAANEADYTMYQSGARASGSDDVDEPGYSVTLDYLDELKLPHFGVYFDQLDQAAVDAGSFDVVGFSGASASVYFRGEPESDSDDPGEDSGESEHDRNRRDIICREGWAVWQELTSADADNPEIGSAFSDALYPRTKDTIVYWSVDPAELVQNLIEHGEPERAVSVCDYLLALPWPTNQWQRRKFDGLTAAGKLDEARELLAPVMVGNLDGKYGFDTLRPYYLAVEPSGDTARMLAANKIDLYDSYSPNQPRTAALSALILGVLGEFDATQWATRELQTFVAFFKDKAGEPAALSGVAGQCVDELSRRQRIVEEVTSAVESGSDVLVLIDQLPRLRDYAVCRPLSQLAASTSNAATALALLRYTMDAVEDRLYFSLYLELLCRGGHMDDARAAIPHALHYARFDSSIYHWAAVAMAETDRDAAMDLVRAAKEFACPTFRDMERDTQLAPLAERPEFNALFAELATHKIWAYDDDRANPGNMVRESYELSLFFDRPIVEAAVELRAVFDSYLRMIGDDALAWGMVGANSSRYKNLKPIDGKLIKRCMNHLDPSKKSSQKDHIFFEMFGAKQDTPAFYCSLSGFNDENTTLSQLRMRVPVDFVEQMSVASFREWAVSMAGQVPLCYGYTSRVLSPSSFYASSPRVCQRMSAYARWYMGLDVCHGFRHHLADRVPGAKWITFIDHGKVERLGGKAALLAHAGHGLEVESVETGIALIAGARPDRGDDKTFANIGPMRTLHELLQPIAQMDWSYNGQLDAYPGGPAAWERRYLPGDAQGC